MGGTWAFLERQANRLGIWVAAISAMTAFYGWVASHLVAFKSYGWAEATLAGAILTLGTMLAISAGMIAWRQFRPLQKRIGANGVPDISTPELAHDLRGELRAINSDLNGQINQQRQSFEGLIAALEKRIQERVDKVDGERQADAIKVRTEAIESAKIQFGMNVELSKDIVRLKEQFHAADIDLIYLFNFVVDSMSVRFLDRIISESPLKGAKNVAEYTDPKERENRRLLFEGFIRNVFGWLGPSLRVHIAREVVKNAEDEMERILLSTPPHQRPENVDPLILRQYTIAELKCRNLVTFLEMQRNEIACGLTRYRDDLLERQRLRQEQKMADLA